MNSVILKALKYILYFEFFIFFVLSLLLIIKIIDPNIFFDKSIDLPVSLSYYDSGKLLPEEPGYRMYAEGKIRNVSDLKNYVKNNSHKVWMRGLSGEVTVDLPKRRVFILSIGLYLIPLGIVLYITYLLRSMFLKIGSGDPVSLEISSRIRTIAMNMVFLAFYMSIYKFYISFVMMQHLRDIKIPVRPSLEVDWSIVLCGIFVYFISELFKQMFHYKKDYDMMV